LYTTHFWGVETDFKTGAKTERQAGEVRGFPPFRLKIGASVGHGSLSLTCTGAKTRVSESETGGILCVMTQFCVTMLLPRVQP